MTWKDEKEWADHYMNETIRIIGNLPIRLLQNQIKIGEIDEDMKRCTDLKILDVGQKRIGVRHRRGSYQRRYMWDVTFRWKAKHGSLTEIDKILDGFGDWFFYAFVSQKIDRWVMIDLAVFRKYWRHLYNGAWDTEYPYQVLYNKDGTAFGAIDLTKWPIDMVLEHSHFRDLLIQQEMLRKPRQGDLF